MCVQHAVEEGEEELGSAPLPPQLFPVLVGVGEIVGHDNAIGVDEGRELLMRVYASPTAAARTQIERAAVLRTVVGALHDRASQSRFAEDDEKNECAPVDALECLCLHFLQHEGRVVVDVIVHSLKRRR